MDRCGGVAGRRILITGGGSGIGLALARRLAPGNTVVIAGRDQSKLERARAETPALRTLRLDVTAEQDAGRAMVWLDAELGGLDVLVNNAGVMLAGGFDGPGAAEASEEEVQVNLLGSLRATRVALPLLRRSDEAAVVFVSSAAALVAAPGLAVYAATKAALHSLARSLRRELAADSIRVFEVLPPWVDTELARRLQGVKLPPEAVADAVVRGLAHDRYEVPVGQIRALALVGRVAPSVADALFARATRGAEKQAAVRGGVG